MSIIHPFWGRVRKDFKRGDFKRELFLRSFPAHPLPAPARGGAGGGVCNLPYKSINTKTQSFFSPLKFSVPLYLCVDSKNDVCSEGFIYRPHPLPLPLQGRGERRRRAKKSSYAHKPFKTVAPKNRSQKKNVPPKPFKTVAKNAEASREKISREKFFWEGLPEKNLT